jgi:hypothetical protein
MWKEEVVTIFGALLDILSQSIQLKHEYPVLGHTEEYLRKTEMNSKLLSINLSLCHEDTLGRDDPSRWPRGTLYPQKLAVTSPTSGGRSVGIVCSRIQATEFNLVLV